jgi:hypothetical protein
MVYFRKCFVWVRLLWTPSSHLHLFFESKVFARSIQFIKKSFSPEKINKKTSWTKWKENRMAAEQKYFFDI